MNLDYSRIRRNAVEDAVIFGGLSAATGVWAQHSVMKNKNEFLSGVKESGVKSFLVEDTFGKDYEKHLKEVAKKGKYNIKSIAKAAGSQALLWGVIGAAFETVRQVLFDN